MLRQNKSQQIFGQLVGVFLLEMFDVQTSQSLDRSAFGVKEKPSNIEYDIVKCGVFSGRPYGAGEIEGFYNGFIFH